MTKPIPPEEQPKVQQEEPAEQEQITLSQTELQMVSSNNNVAFNLFRVAQEDKSQILSPLSITYALSMLNNGASGETQQEINQTLGFFETDIDSINVFCKKMLDGAPALDKDTKVLIGNTIYTNKGYTLKTDFVKKAQKYYDATPESRNFHDGKTLNVINQWASDHTNKMIDQVLDDQTFNPNAVSYLLNAIYFKGAWAEKFNKNLTQEELFNDKADQCLLWKEAVKYYTNILNPFSMMVTKKLQEIAGMNLQFDIIAPSHGAIWRDNPLQIVKKYAQWADAYQENQITVAYDTMWEGTTKIAHKIAEEIHRQSPDTVVKVFNVAKADKNEVMTEVFKSKAIAVGSPTVSNSILSSVAGWLEFLKQLKFKNKKAAAFGCYGWSGESVKILQERLKDAGFEVIDDNIRASWVPTETDLEAVPALVSHLLGNSTEA